MQSWQDGHENCKPKCKPGLRNERAHRTLRSLDEGNISEAYLHDDLDIEGDMLNALYAA